MSNWPTYQAAPQIDVPPWNWNPAATYLNAYNTMEQAKMERAKFENEQQITQILLPYKVKRAALDLEELKSQIKTNEAAMDIRRDELSYRNRALEEEMRSRNKPKAIWNPSTGGFEPTATDDYLPPLSQNSRDSGAGSVEPPLPGGPSADPNLPIDPDLVPPMRDDEDLPDVSSADNNPLTRFAQSDSGFNNPLAKIDDNAANVPIGEQYLGGENNLAAGKFDSSLKEAAPASGFDLSSLPDVRSQEEPSMSEDEKAIQEIQAERKAFEQNVYEMRRQGYDIRPDDLRAGYASLEQKAKAKLIPFIPQLGEAGLESFKALNSGDTPIETAYAAAKKYSKAAQANLPKLDPSAALEERLNQSSYRIGLLLEKGLPGESPEVQQERGNFRRLQNLKSGIDDSPVGQVYSADIDLKNLQIARDSGEIDEATYAQKAGPIQQQLALARREALSTGRNVINLNDYNTDDKGNFTPDGLSKLSSDLEKYKDNIVGLSGMRGDKKVFMARRVTDDFIENVKSGRFGSDQSAATAKSATPLNPNNPNTGAVAKSQESLKARELDQIKRLLSSKRRELAMLKPGSSVPSTQSGYGTPSFGGLRSNMTDSEKYDAYEKLATEIKDLESRISKAE